MDSEKTPEVSRAGDLEVLRLDETSWRIRDMSAIDAPCPIVGVVDRIGDAFRVTLLDQPADPQLHDSLDDAICSIEFRRAS